MKRRLALLWLLLPLPLVALHFGAGQRWLARDRAAAHARAAQRAARTNGWDAAEQATLAALAALDPAAHDARARLRLDLAAARLERGDAAAALEGLEALLADPTLASATEQTRNALHEQLAETSFLAAWVMRLEGAARDEWLPDAEQARQHYRLLAEQMPPGAEQQRQAENLEAVIQLERADLDTLRARPLPRKCSGMCGKRLASKRRGNCQSPGTGNGQKGQKGPSDCRGKTPQNGAGLGGREEGLGS